MKASRRREGELVALAFNQKEQRLLEKSVATIRHEASYSLKLLEVNNRNLKVYFRHLRDKVSRLKSHLSVDQIQQLRKLEDEGKLHPTHPSVNLGSALKIAATHRRLHPSHLRPPSTPGGYRTPLYPTPTPATNGQPPTQRLKRSNSVTGVFIDVPQSAYSDHRPQSASVTLNGRTAQLNPAVSSKRATKGGAVVPGSPVNITSSLGKGEENGREKSVQSRDSTVTPDQREPLQTSTVHAQQHNPSEHNQPRPTTASSAHSVTCQSGGPPSIMSSAHNVTNQSGGLSRGSSAHNVTSQSGGLSRGSSAHNVTSQSGGLSRGSSAHNVTSQSGGLSRGSSAHNVTNQSGGLSRGSSAHNVTSQSGGLSRGSSAHNVTSQSGGLSRGSSAHNVTSQSGGLSRGSSAHNVTSQSGGLSRGSSAHNVTSQSGGLSRGSSAHNVTSQSGGLSRGSSAHNVTSQSGGLSRDSSAHNVTSQSGGLSRGSSAHNVTSQSGGLSRGSSAHNVTSQSGGLSRGSSAHNVTSQSGGLSRGSSAHNVTSQSGGLSRGSSAHNVTSQSGGPSRTSSAFVRTPFSSHTAREKAVVEGEGGGRRQSSDLIVGLSPRSRYSSMDKESTFLALLQDDSMDDLDQELFQERREELIEEEQLRQVSLTKRKDRFLKDLDNYLHDHPPPSIIPRRHGSARKVTLVRKNEAEGEEELPEAMFRRRRVDFDLNPTCLPETDYRQRLQGLWKDMNKCRYLRMSDDLLDLSGVNTLATDNLKLYTVLKKQDRRLSVAARPPTREI